MSYQLDFDKLPLYIQEYLNKKSISTVSKEGYTRDILEFLDWLVHKDLSDTKIKDITLTELEKINAVDIGRYKKYLLRKKPQPSKEKLGLSHATVARKLSSIRSLFNYLANEAEYNNGEPFLKRNIFYQIKINSPKKPIYQAVNEMNKLSNTSSKELYKFRDFISKEYGLKIQSTKRLTNYKKNKERDTAIISLLLDSGIRLNEISGLTLEEIDLNNNLLKLKENRNIFLTSQAKSDLREYLRVREDRYGANKEIFNVFLTNYNKKPKAIHIRSIQKMIEKYAEEFDKVGLTAKDLRHSFAARLFNKTKSISQMQHQLGQETINPIWLYNNQNKNGNIN